MRNPKVAVVGSANVDLVLRTERMPIKGETLSSNNFYRHIVPLEQRAFLKGKRYLHARGVICL